MKPKIILCLALVLSGLLDLNCNAAIIFPKAPEGGQQIAHESVAWILQTNPSFLGGARIEELTIADPHQNYNANPQDVTSGNLLSAARLATGRWRYFVMRGTNAVGVVALRANEKAGKALKFVELDSPARAAKLQIAQRKAEELPQVKKQDYEFRFLNLAPLSFFAVWLHGKSDDIIIPLPPTWEIWNAYQPYSETQITELLKKYMEKMPNGPIGTVD
jgi:hypothetical protein